MTVWLVSATVALSVFAVVAAAGSTLVTGVVRTITRCCEGRSPAACAAALFRLRMLPGVLAAVIAFAVVLPTFLAYEPPNTEEPLPITVVLLAVVGSALLLRGAARAARAWTATRNVMRDWRLRGRRIDAFDTALPLFAIDEAFPTVAVVGVTRPALFIAERVLRECGDDEVRAMLQHECAHVATRDNLKRFLMRACPDFVGGELERAWARAAEEAADAAVVQHDPGFAVELAQALIHVARLAPAPEAPALASAFYLGGSIESRVRRLVQPAPTQERTPEFSSHRLAIVVLAAAACALAAAPSLHHAIETAVHSLP